MQNKKIPIISTQNFFIAPMYPCSQTIMLAVASARIFGNNEEKFAEHFKKYSNYAIGYTCEKLAVGVAAYHFRKRESKLTSFNLACQMFVSDENDIYANEVLDAIKERILENCPDAKYSGGRIEHSKNPPTKTLSSLRKPIELKNPPKR